MANIKSNWSLWLILLSEKLNVPSENVTVTWKKRNGNNDWEIIAHRSPPDTVGLTEPERFDLTGDFSLTIFDVQPSDECLYRCIGTYRNQHGYETFGRFVQLNVTSPIEDLRIYSENNTDALYQSIVCEATNGKPAASLSWVISGEEFVSGNRDFKITHDQDDAGYGRTTSRSKLTFFQNFDRQEISVDCIAKQPSFRENSISTDVEFESLVAASTESHLLTSGQKIATTTSPTYSKRISQMKEMVPWIAITTCVIMLAIMISIIAVAVSCRRRNSSGNVVNIENNSDDKLAEQQTIFDTVVQMAEPGTRIELLEPAPHRSHSRDSGYVEHSSLSTEMTSPEQGNVLAYVTQTENHTNWTSAEEGSSLVEVNMPEDDVISTTSNGTTSSEESFSDRPLASDYVHAELDREVSRDDVQVGLQIGEGHFGRVCKGCLKLQGKQEQKEVAIKILPACTSTEEYDRLIRELDIMKKLKPHPRVVQLLACCTLPKKESIFLIVEYLPNGSLKDYLLKNRPTTNTPMTDSMERCRILTDKDLIKFAFQVAEGMTFLHENNLIHRDLASRNILVTSDVNCKISDFGLARNIGPNQEYVMQSPGTLPLRWEAPESLTSNVYNFKSDVWSYGILLWEIITFGERPYPDFENCDDVRTKVKEGYTMAIPEHCQNGLGDIIKQCWQHDAKKRPSFNRIADNLKSMKKEHVDVTFFIESFDPCMVPGTHYIPAS
ncbi:fibroblast growth factor receptor 1-A-like isoform X2 [Ptychodera flava]|uniref:fibroblast growth factor receptor 1-A-like isoform X2 n=1 Tax=Ptychodera flava TaxID=63121 RepID=UPI00396A0172